MLIDNTLKIQACYPVYVIEIAGRVKVCMLPAYEWMAGTNRWLLSGKHPGWQLWTGKFCVQDSFLGSFVCWWTFRHKINSPWQTKTPLIPNESCFGGMQIHTFSSFSFLRKLMSSNHVLVLYSFFLCYYFLSNACPNEETISLTETASSTIQICAMFIRYSHFQSIIMFLSM